MVVVSALGAGTGIAAGPDTGVDSVDGPSILEGVGGQEAAQRLAIDLAVAQGRVEAPPTPPMGGFQAQVDERGDRIGSQDGVDQLERASARLPKQP